MASGCLEEGGGEKHMVSAFGSKDCFELKEEADQLISDLNWCDSVTDCKVLMPPLRLPKSAKGCPGISTGYNLISKWANISEAKRVSTLYNENCDTCQKYITADIPRPGEVVCVKNRCLYKPTNYLK